MRPISLCLHEKPITQLLFNREGDLLFVAAKDKLVSLWYTSTGERIGSYTCGGAVYAMGVSQNSQYLITASADAKVKVWDVQTGICLHTENFEVSCRSIEYNQGESQILVVTDQVMGCKALIHVLDFDQATGKLSTNFTFESPNCKITHATWGPLNQYIFSSGEDGAIRIYDVEKKSLHHTFVENTKKVNRIEWTKHRIMFLTCSNDGTAKLYNTKTLENIKTFETGRPVNAAGVSPIKPHIILGGGQSAGSVTTSKVDASQFKVRFYHIVYGDELGSLNGHIGPVYSICFTPDGKTFATGGEEGLVQINHLDDSYFQFDQDLVYTPKQQLETNNEINLIV
ncbi:hypothetical protein CYY_008810 [Polysphondylium violaceum]|uniref:Eukaryotic translation initiation factor 3 subunit I n=1 Tax=Polysphondylium violaceum TaxID=133409 RepID=A0A8J4UWM9_9MYCE|nr:hypothetical protein CYY_008810 [Polysphondylium violaceum]